MRILGIDYGDKNIGLAVSDLLGITAQGLGLYRQKSSAQDLAYFRGLVEEYGIERIVVGLPLRMDGTQGSRAEKTREFAERLGTALGLPVVFWDERLTTKEALGVLREQKASRDKRKVMKDQIAAVLILSSYLESER
jgi:putative Holliday junction resolvase